MPGKRKTLNAVWQVIPTLSDVDKLGRKTKSHQRMLEAQNVKMSKQDREEAERETHQNLTSGGETVEDTNEVEVLKVKGPAFQKKRETGNSDGTEFDSSTSANLANVKQEKEPLLQPPLTLQNLTSGGKTVEDTNEVEVLKVKGPALQKKRETWNRKEKPGTASRPDLTITRVSTSSHALADSPDLCNTVRDRPVTYSLGRSICITTDKIGSGGELVNSRGTKNSHGSELNGKSASAAATNNINPEVSITSVSSTSNGHLADCPTFNTVHNGTEASSTSDLQTGAQQNQPIHSQWSVEFSNSNPDKSTSHIHKAETTPQMTATVGNVTMNIGEIKEIKDISISGNADAVAHVISKMPGLKSNAKFNL